MQYHRTVFTNLSPILLLLRLQFTDDLAKECNDIGLIATTENTSNIRNFEIDPFNGFLFWIKDYETVIF